MTHEGLRSATNSCTGSSDKQHWAEEEPKLDNARRIRGICNIDPEDKEFKDTLKNARKKLEVYMDSAMPRKSRKTSGNLSLKASKDPQE